MSETCMSAEEPASVTLRRNGDFETRRYNGYIVAQVEVRSDFDDALTRGFRALFNYINGGNKIRSKIPMAVPVTEEIVQRPEQIPMTALVTSEKVVEGLYRVFFIMPGKYTLDTLPEPDDREVHFIEVPEHEVAVINFSGHSHERKVQEKIKELSEWLRENNLTPKSAYRLARYDPPWVLGFMRHNEIMVDI